MLNFRSLLTLGLVASTLLTVTLARASEVSDYAKAEALIRQGHWDQGIALLWPVIHAQPHNPKARNLMGIAQTGKGDLAKANEQFRRALKIDSRFYPALKNLAVNELTLKKVAVAKRDFTTALKLAPNDPTIHAYLGEIAYGRREYTEASAHLNKAGPFLLGAPELALHLAGSYLETGQEGRGADLLNQLNERGLDPRLQFQAGYLLARHDLFSQATPFFRAVGERFPESYDAGFNLAVCYVQLKQYPAAIEVLSRLRDRGHKTAELDNLLAEAYEGNKQTQNAINLLREATFLEPEDENNYLDLAALCIDHPAYELGVEVVNIGLRYRPESDRLVFQRGVLYALLDRFKLAEHDFEVASQMAPEKDLAYVGLSLAHIQKGKLTQAAEVLRRRIRQQPNDYVLQYLLGEALIRSGVIPGQPALVEARTALEKSVRLNTNFSRSHIGLAKIYLKENRTDEAIQHLEKARELDPGEKAVYSNLATAYRRKGDPDKVAAMLAMVKKLNDDERAHNYRDLVRIVKEGPGQDLALQKLQDEQAERRNTPSQTDQALPPR